MTIATETTKVTVLGNGAQTVFNYAFLLPAVGQYALYYTDAAGGITLISQVNYTVSGVGNPNGGTFTYAPGGNPIATGTSLTFTRAVPYTQTTELNNQGAYYPQVLETALDRLVLQTQQLRTDVDLAFKAPITNAAVADVPTASVRANGWAFWDADGNLTSSEEGWPGSPAGSLQITGAQNILMDPVANPVATQSSLTATAETQYDNAREFLVSFGFTSNRGSAAASPARDKVTLYAAMLSEDGTGDAWSFNTVHSLFPGPATYNAFGYELDFNNLNGHRGDIPGAFGLAAPVAYGQAITGFAAYRSTAALAITGGVSEVWNRGIVVTNGVVQASFQDVSLAERSLDIRSGSDIGLSLENGAFTRAAVLVGNGAPIGWRNAADSTDYLMLYLDGSNNFNIGGGVPPVIALGASTSVRPASDAAVSLGTGSFRWSEVYAANGTINTSDVRAKNSVQKVGSLLDVLRAIAPISFKFNVGGADTETVVEQKLAPVYETVPVDRERIVVAGGQARVEKYKATEQRKIMDAVPVLGPNGKRQIVWTKAVRDPATGAVTLPAMPVEKTHLVPRMAMQPVERVVTTPRAGTRRHYGFAAGDFKDAFDKLGLGDFGGYVVAADGTEGLRDHQITALLWQIVREMDDRLLAVESR